MSSVPLPGGFGGGGTSGAAAAGVWTDLGTTILAAPADTITVNLSDTMDWLLLVYDCIKSATGFPTLNFNADAGANYNGVIHDPTPRVTYAASIRPNLSSGDTLDHVTGFAMVNNRLAAQTKLVTFKGTRAAGETWGSIEWTNVADRITRVDILQRNGAAALSNMAAGSYLQVLGFNVS